MGNCVEDKVWSMTFSLYFNQAAHQRTQVFKKGIVWNSRCFTFSMLHKLKWKTQVYHKSLLHALGYCSKIIMHCNSERMLLLFEVI